MKKLGTILNRILRPSITWRGWGVGLLMFVSLPTFATDWNAKTDTVWAGRHYREINGIATDVCDQNTTARWNYPTGTMLVYGLRMPNGHVRGDLTVTVDNGHAVNLHVRILYPATNSVIVDHTVKTAAGKTSKQTIEFLPDTELAQDGWYRMEVTSDDAKDILTMHHLLFQRTSRQTVTDANSLMTQAVHLWWSSTDPGANTTEDRYDWVYMEARVPEAFKQSCTYQMTIGSSGLYSGIQTNHLLADDSWTHAVIFSAWDNGDVDVDKNLPDYLRSGALDTGDEAYAVRFGGEGTGASLRYPEGQRWQTDHWVQMLLYERPDYMETVSTDAEGKATVMPFRSTLLSYWYKQAEETEWHYFGTLRMANNYRMEGNNSGLYSFLENWSGFGGDLYRRVYYRNGCMRSAASGKWFSLNKVGFGSTDKNTRNSRTDYGHGVTRLYENSFYLESGGYIAKDDSANTYPYVAQGKMPWVDTINIQALRDRVDKAVLRNNNKDILFRIEGTSVVSDPATWQLIGYSDEETQGEGDYGRAAQIMDGSTTTYYRNQYNPTWKGFPHMFSFDAGEPVTVRSIGLYQSQDVNHRAKDMQLYLSEDGKSWTNKCKVTFPESDAPSVVLPEPVTSRYFRLRFTSGYGWNDGRLAINEVYFKNEYRLEDMKVLASELLAQEDCFSGYRPEDLKALKDVYDEGRCTDLEALKSAIEALGASALPLTWGNVDKISHISSFSAYQLHNVGGLGNLVVDEAGKLTLSGATAEGALEAYCQPTRVSQPLNNWLVLRSERFGEYYIYNLGAKKYLNLTTDRVYQLADEPQAFALTLRNNAFMLGTRAAHVTLNAADAEVPVAPSSRIDDTCLFELRNNYGLSPADQEICQQLAACEGAVHVGVEDIVPDENTLIGKLVSVYNLQGVEVCRAPYERIPRLKPGTYVLKSGKKVVKRLIQ